MKKIFILLIACTIFYVALAFARDKIIISGHPEYPPVTWREGETIVGAAAEMAATIFTELGIPYKFEATGPWKRVQMNARQGIIDVIAAAYHNPTRQQYMDYTIAFMEDPVSVFVLEEKSFPFNKWEDLIGKTGNTALGESYGKKFDQFIKQKLTVERTPTLIQNFRKLEAGHVDYAIIGLYPGLAYASVTGFKDKIAILPNNILEEKFYMTFSEKSEFAHLLPKVNKIITRLKKQGLIEQWIKKYLDHYETVKTHPHPAGQ